VHIKRVHSEEERVRKYACDMCDKLFFEPDKVRKHKRFFHLKLRNYKCNLCGETFRQKTTLDNHLDKHAGISFSCPHCTEKFACKSYVRKHLRKRHRELLAPKK
jgi:KRAB domain-containing zinc finger protein